MLQPFHQHVIARAVNATFLLPADVDRLADDLHLTDQARSLFKLYTGSKVDFFHNILNRYDYQLISLGYNCLPHTIPTRWGIKPNQAMGQPRMPFDLAVHQLEAVKQLLIDDFIEYEPALDNGKNCFVGKNHKITFNHDYVPARSKNDTDPSQILSAFTHTLMERVNNFKKAMIQGNCIAILYLPERYSNDNRSIDADALYSTLLEIEKRVLSYSSRNVFMCVAVGSNGDPGPLKNQKHFFQFALPHAAYEWFKPSCYFSKAGFDLEKSFIEFIAAIIQEKMPKRKAKAYSDDVFLLHTKSSSFLISASKAFTNLGEMEQAILKAREAIAVNDTNPGFYLHLGRLLRQTGDLEGARQAQDKAIALDPSLPDPHLQLSYIYESLKETDKAILKARDAISANDSNPKAHIHLGNLLRSIGDMEGTNKAQARALALDPLESTHVV